MARLLSDWDSVGFALSFTNFNIEQHQPQPPGYIFFVGFGKIINLIFNDPNTTIIAINILFSILTVIIIYFLAKKMFSRIFAVITSILLVFNPIFWFYGEISAIYMSEALSASMIAYTSYQVLMGDNRFLYISTIVLGLSGGFRQDILILMFPLWFFCILYRCREIRRIVKILIVLAASIALWFVPTIIFAGGLENYLLASKNLFMSSFSGNSIFYGADLNQHLIMDAKFIFWFIIGMGISGTVLLLIYIVYKLPRIRLSQFKDLKFIFILLWIIPSSIFYLMVLFAKPGYLMIYIPTFSMIMTYVIINISTDLNRKIKRIPKNYFLIIFCTVVMVSGLIQFIYPSESGIYYMRIQSEEANYQNIYDSVGKFIPQNTVIFTDDEVNWRKTAYYFPDYQIYSYQSYFSSGNLIKELLHYKNGEIQRSPSEIFEIHLNSSTTKIYWMVDYNSDFFKKIQSKIEIKSLKLPNGHKVYYSEVNDKTNFQIGIFIFKRD